LNMNIQMSFLWRENPCLGRDTLTSLDSLERWEKTFVLLDLQFELTHCNIGKNGYPMVTQSLSVLLRQALWRGRLMRADRLDWEEEEEEEGRGRGLFGQYHNICMRWVGLSCRSGWDVEEGRKRGEDLWHWHSTCMMAMMMTVRGKCCRRGKWDLEGEMDDGGLFHHNSYMIVIG